MQDLLSVANKDYSSKRAAWFKVIEDYTGSGESQANFCKQRNIKMDHFAYYLGCWRKANAATKAATVSFMEMQIVDNKTNDKFVLTIATGIKLEIPMSIPLHQVVELILNIRAKSC